MHRLLSFVAIICAELTSSIEGAVISSCTPGTPGVGHLGDTCIISYQNGARVMEMWSCESNMSWVKTSGSQSFFKILEYKKSCMFNINEL